FVCQQQCGENQFTCPQDCFGGCGFCGDGVCQQQCGENQQTCPFDCGMMACAHCNEAVTQGQMPICGGHSQTLFNNLVTCICGGACAMQCGNNACAGGMPSAACQQCIQDPNGCGNQLNQCLADQ